MRGYERDEYEDYDDYEEDGGEQEEDYEEEEEEDPKPSKEQLEFLEYRQRRKERLRKEKMKKEGPSASQDIKKLPYDNYGSFFGPSKPVIAQRVIQESKSLLENRHLATRVLQSQYKNQKSSSSTSMGSRPVVRDKIPKGNNVVNHKAQKLKDTRDYSFLFSDDAELPAPAKQPPSRNTYAPTSEARPAKMPLPSKQASVSNGRIPHNVRDDRRPPSMNGQTNSRPGATKLSSTTKSNSMLAADKRQLHSTNRNGPGQPGMTNGLQQKKPLAILGKNSQVAKISTPVMSKPLAAKIPSPALKHSVQQRKDVGNPNKYKIAPKQPATSIKPQVTKPPKQISSAVKSQNQKPKKKPIRPFSDDEDDDGVAINMIRKMFGYNPDRYAGRDDDDDSDMEANFDEIMKEEKRSAKIARKEDEEQQRLIEEEERREEMRKMAKKRKLSH